MPWAPTSTFESEFLRMGRDDPEGGVLVGADNVSSLGSEHPHQRILVFGCGVRASPTSRQ